MLCALLMTGCAAQSTPPTPAEPAAEAPTLNEENTDPTAMHLHDVAGRLLLFCARHEKLPARLEDLAPLPGDNGKPSATDPATGQPYTYSPDGLKPRGLPGRVIIYQSIATGTGKQKNTRWVLLFNDRLREARVQRVPDALLQNPLE